MKLLKTIIAATLAAACVLPAQAADKTMSTDIVVLGRRLRRYLCQCGSSGTRCQGDPA